MCAWSQGMLAHKYLNQLTTTTTWMVSWTLHRSLSLSFWSEIPIKFRLTRLTETTSYYYSSNVAGKFKTINHFQSTTSSSGQSRWQEMSHIKGFLVALIQDTIIEREIMKISYNNSIGNATSSMFHHTSDSGSRRKVARLKWEFIGESTDKKVDRLPFNLHLILLNFVAITNAIASPNALNRPSQRRSPVKHVNWYNRKKFDRVQWRWSRNINLEGDDDYNIW